MTRTAPRWAAAACALLVLAPAALAQPAANPLGFEPDTPGLDPYEVAMVRTVSGVAVSPDGRYVAYRLSIPADPLTENAPARSELRLHDTRTGETAAPLPGRGVSALHFLPDGRLVFLSRLEGDTATTLHAFTPGGAAPERLLAFGTGIQRFSVSADGQHVAFVADEPAEAADTGGVPDVAEVYEEEPTFSRVYVARLGDAAAPALVALTGHVHDVALAPSGDRLAIAAAPTPSVDDSYVGQRIYITDLAGAVLAEVDRAGKQGGLAWSPDGQTLAMVAAEDINDPAAGRLMVVPATGGAPRDLLPGLEGHVQSVSWSADGEVHYVVAYGVETAHEAIAADGSGRRTLVEPGAYVIDEAAHGGGLGAFVIQTPMHPPELYLRPEGGPLARVTDSNPWLADVALGRQEVITYQARDGVEIEGVLVYPVGYAEGTRYPLVLSVHGGPESHFSNGWNNYYSQIGQMAAARGYAVFFPNYRGSTGYGVAFSKTSQGDAAGAEFDDLIDGIDALVERGLVDGERVGVTGGSYGGYATAWLSTRYSDRIAAGVMFVGISNTISKVGTTDIPQEEFHVHARQRPWDDWQGYLERSPIYYAGQSTTPLLILHGKDDPRVNPGQSLELYRHRKLRSEAPVRLVYYPGEGHGNRRATARLDYSLRALRWFDHFLKGGADTAPPAAVDYRAAFPEGFTMGTN